MVDSGFFLIVSCAEAREEKIKIAINARQISRKKSFVLKLVFMESWFLIAAKL
jgi:hypothetical protein